MVCLGFVVRAPLSSCPDCYCCSRLPVFVWQCIRISSRINFCPVQHVKRYIPCDVMSGYEVHIQSMTRHVF